MTVGESPAAARRRLRLALRAAREAKRLTQRQVATSLDWSLSKVNRIEAGEVTVSSTDLQALLRLLDITDDTRVEQLTAEARASRRRGWWDQPEYREHLTAATIQELQYETEATAIRSFQPTFLPGPLQTPAYAAAIVGLWSDELSEADRATRAEVRGRRREQLFGRPEPPDYLLILDESVLLREVGGPQVVAEQFADLLSLVHAQRLAVRILPLAHAAAYAIGGFTIYSSDDEDVALYRESHLADEMVYAPDTVRRHRRIFDQMWEHCLTVEASIRRIEARAATLRSVLDDADG
jgi:transcriptional regulator with XRE-family HTH domain